MAKAFASIPASKKLLAPLRDRRDDIPDLANYFLSRSCAEMSVAPKRLTDDALALLRSYPWPGNVRELENSLKRAVILSNDPLLTARDFGGLLPVGEIVQTGTQETSLEALVDI